MRRLKIKMFFILLLLLLKLRIEVDRGHNSSSILNCKDEKIIKEKEMKSQ